MRTLNDYFLYGVINDVSTAQTVRIPVPDAGKVIKISGTTKERIEQVKATLA